MNEIVQPLLIYKEDAKVFRFEGFKACVQDRILRDWKTCLYTLRLIEGAVKFRWPNFTTEKHISLIQNFERTDS